jgi:hypothetical protein
LQKLIRQMQKNLTTLPVHAQGRNCHWIDVNLKEKANCNGMNGLRKIKMRQLIPKVGSRIKGQRGLKGNLADEKILAD